MNLSPQANSGIPYHFKKKKDAEEFKKYEYANTIYQTNVYKNKS